jgi:large repetitive protein
VTNETAGGGGSVSIVNGPAGGPSAGSLQMSLSGTSDHWDAFNYDHQGVPLSSISILSYSAYTNNAPTYDPGFQMTADLSPSLTFATVNYEPYEQTPPDTANTWQSFNVLTGLVWATHIAAASPGGINDPISWSAFLNLYPAATVLGVGADVGGSWPAMIGNVDAISIGTDGAGGATTTYDFSPNTAPVVTTQPLSQNYTSGSMLTFTAAASGIPTPTVQWQYSVNSGSTWNNLSGATTPSITNGPWTAFENHWELRAVFTNSVGSAASNAATMTET